MDNISSLLVLVHIWTSTFLVLMKVILTRYTGWSIIHCSHGIVREYIFTPAIAFLGND